MEIKDNFSIFNLFLDKHIKIQTNMGSFSVKVPTIKEFSLYDNINAVYHIWVLDSEDRKRVIPIACNSSFELLNAVLFQFGIYKEYSEITSKFKDALSFFIPHIEINNKDKQLIVDDIIITEDI